MRNKKLNPWQNVGLKRRELVEQVKAVRGWRVKKTGKSRLAPVIGNRCKFGGAGDGWVLFCPLMGGP